MLDMVKNGKLTRKLKTITCDLCHQPGHNKRTCKGQTIPVQTGDNNNKKRKATTIPIQAPPSKKGPTQVAASKRGPTKVVSSQKVAIKVTPGPSQAGGGVGRVRGNNAASGRGNYAGDAGRGRGNNAGGAGRGNNAKVGRGNNVGVGKGNNAVAGRGRGNAGGGVGRGKIQKLVGVRERMQELVLVWVRRKVQCDPVLTSLYFDPV
ncbi:hypothetical protein Tco_1149383 [Tanacetum coccineum]